MPITKRPCSNCPFRKGGAGIKLQPGRLAEIVSDLIADDMHTFVCHKSLDTSRMTCIGAVGVLSKLGQLPVIARLGLTVGVITRDDIAQSAEMVVDPVFIDLDRPQLKKTPAIDAGARFPTSSAQACS